MATWSAFEAAVPELAEAGHRLLYQFGPGLGYLATVRKDGGPRVHPFCPIVAEGELWAFIIRDSPKCLSLARGGRSAVAALPAAAKDDAFAMTGAAARVGDAGARDKVVAGTTAQVG